MRSIFDNKSLIEWLGKQEAGHYRYFCPSGCLLAQYFREMGFDDPMVTGTAVTLNGKCKPLPPYWDRIASQPPHSFAGAHKRALAYLKSAA